MHADVTHMHPQEQHRAHREPVVVHNAARVTTCRGPTAFAGPERASGWNVSALRASSRLAAHYMGGLDAACCAGSDVCCSSSSDVHACAMGARTVGVPAPPDDVGDGRVHAVVGAANQVHVLGHVRQHADVGSLRAPHARRGGSRQAGGSMSYFQTCRWIWQEQNAMSCSNLASSGY